MLKRFLFLLTFTSASVGFSQLTSLNPNSSYGIGNQILSTDAIQAAMGGSTIAFSDSTMVNYANSANVASITKGYPLFSIGVNGAYTNYIEGASSYSRGFATLDHMIFAVPFKKIFGIGFGLTPYARRGYEFKFQEVFDTDTLNSEYSGNGNLSKAFVALSTKIIDRRNFDLSIGTNLGYVFGTTTNARLTYLSETGNAKGLAVQSDKLTSFHYDFSLSTMYRLNKNNSIRITGFYDPSQSLTGTFADELFFEGSDNSAQPIYSLNTDAIYKSAASLRLGGNYTTQFKRETKKNKTYYSELNFTAEYNSTTFSQFEKNHGAIITKPYNHDYERISFGVQYTPNTGFYSNMSRTGFFNKLKYRAGAYTSNLPYEYSGETFKDFGTTFGIGIPMASSNAFSSVNIGMNVGRRSNSQAGALNENYYGFNIGIIIAPSKGDYWFRKVKLD